MNRLGIDNFMAPLTDSMELEFNNEYIIYRTDNGIVNSLYCVSLLYSPEYYIIRNCFAYQIIFMVFGYLRQKIERG